MAKAQQVKVALVVGDFKLHDRAHDGMNPGEIIKVDEARGLYLFEYEIWPGEPLGSKWCKADELRLRLPVVELARAS